MFYTVHQLKSHSTFVWQNNTNPSAKKMSHFYIPLNIQDNYVTSRDDWPSRFLLIYEPFILSVFLFILTWCLGVNIMLFQKYPAKEASSFPAFALQLRLIMQVYCSMRYRTRICQQSKMCTGTMECLFNVRCVGGASGLFSWFMRFLCLIFLQ